MTPCPRHILYTRRELTTRVGQRWQRSYAGLSLRLYTRRELTTRVGQRWQRSYAGLSPRRRPGPLGLQMSDKDPD
jgi:hypothetical protein